MRTIQLFIIISFVHFQGFGQKLSEEFNYKVIYGLSFQLDSTDVNSKKSEYMVLFLGDNLSKYSSRAKTLANKIVRDGNSAHTSRSALTNFHYEIIKNHKDGKLLYLLQIPKMNDKFYYLQDKNLFNWKIEDEIKEIKGYKVQKATTSFAGRDYIAWFTPEVPISDGPYKFGGLPGLILEIADTDKDWNFEFFGLEQLSPKLDFKLNLKQYTYTEKQELLDLWYRYRRDPMGYANNPNVKPNPEVDRLYVEAFTEMLEKENNPIELK